MAFARNDLEPEHTKTKKNTPKTNKHLKKKLKHKTNPKKGKQKRQKENRSPHLRRLKHGGELVQLAPRLLRKNAGQGL